MGDVMYDSILFNTKIAEGKSSILRDLDMINASKVKDYALATVHRQENTDNPEKLRSIFEALSDLSIRMKVIMPLHPQTRKYLENSSFTIPSQVYYLDMLLREKNARMILTDSGGVQKEAYFFKVRCITLREEAEWIEIVKNSIILRGMKMGYPGWEDRRRGHLNEKGYFESAWSWGFIEIRTVNFIR